MFLGGRTQATDRACSTLDELCGSQSADEGRDGLVVWYWRQSNVFRRGEGGRYGERSGPAAIGSSGHLGHSFLLDWSLG